MKTINPKLKTIRDEVLACEKCPLFQTRTYPVIGQGSHQAKIVLVGEAPGYHEDKTGRPFLGQAGKILDELLACTEIKREEIYICNILKCRPPKNRNPLPKEITACTPYLIRQLNIIQPHVICCLGSFATCFIMEQFNLSQQSEGISKIHGKVFNTKNGEQEVKIIPLYHPAVAAYKQEMIETLKKDFMVVKTES